MEKAFCRIPEPECVETPERMLQVCRMVEQSGMAAIDTETTGLDRARDRAVIWSLYTGEGPRFTIDGNLLHILDQELAHNPYVTWLFANVNFDLAMLRNSGVRKFTGYCHDTLVMDNLYDDTQLHGLKDTSYRYCGIRMKPFKEVFKAQRNMREIDVMISYWEQGGELKQQAIDYASLDAYATWEVYHFLREKLKNELTAFDQTLWDYYTRLEVPYSDVLYECEARGICVDTEHLQLSREQIVERLKEIRYDLNKASGVEFNYNSPMQMRNFFIGRLDRPVLKMTKGGTSGKRNPSTDKEVLEQWAKAGCPYADMVIEARHLDKIKSTYIDGMLSHLDDNGRVHTTIKQYHTRTGRTSSSDPNLQNIPRPSDDIYQLRAAIIADDGEMIYAADYSQVEMRILAHRSQDPEMIGLIHRGWDVHMGTASIMYQVPYDEMVAAKMEAKKLEDQHVPQIEWPEEVRRLMSYRQTSKTLGFGIVYGEGIIAQAEKLGITKDEAKARRELYFEPFPRIREYIEETHQAIRADLCATTLFGRVRRLRDADTDWKPGFYDHRRKRQVPERPGKFAAGALREGFNHGIQGTAAELIKAAQIAIEDDARLDNLGYYQVLQVHDEVLGCGPKDEATQKEIRARLSEVMQTPVQYLHEMLGVPLTQLDVPLDVDVGAADSWAGAH